MVIKEFLYKNTVRHNFYTSKLSFFILFCCFIGQISARDNCWQCSHCCTRGQEKLTVSVPKAACDKRSSQQKWLLHSSSLHPLAFCSPWRQPFLQGCFVTETGKQTQLVIKLVSTKVLQISLKYTQAAEIVSRKRPALRSHFRSCNYTLK